MSIEAYLYNQQMFKGATNNLPIEIEDVDFSSYTLFFHLASDYGQDPILEIKNIAIAYDSTERVSSSEIVVDIDDLEDVAVGKYVYTLGYSTTGNLNTSKIIMAYGQLKIVNAINNE